MYRLKPIDEIRNDELACIVASHAAVWALESTQQGRYGNILGLEQWLSTCTKESGPQDRHAKTRGWARLIKTVEEGKLLLLERKPAFLAALCQVNEQWVVTPLVWNNMVRHRLEWRVSTLQWKQKEKADFIAQQPKAERVEELMPFYGPGNRKPTLGPHESGQTGAVNSSKPTPPITTTPASKSVSDQFNALKTQGHGPQRHEGDVTPQQLEDRCTKGIDPMSGTTTDAVTGKSHKYSANATKVNTPEDYVTANNKLKNSQEFKDKTKLADSNGEVKIVVESTKLKDIFGQDYPSIVTGRTRIGTKNNPAGAKLTKFTDDSTMLGVYIKNSKGLWELRTMYPNP